mmetsp:Transcript_43115/g.115908  ORF Transcript_43115/g.115908 Transcript_43115/m.115908 type:complete len:361 (+) Transcript_43115:1146-2228(+)
MLLTSSKGPPRCAETSWASRSRALDLASLAALRSSCRARPAAPPGPGPPVCRKLRGDGGGTGFSGGSVRTPVTSDRILMAASIALSSCARVLERSAHCASFVEHFCSVWLSSAESAARSAWVEIRSSSALVLAACASLAAPSLLPLAFWVAEISFARAAAASWYAFTALVSALTAARRSASNLWCSCFSSSMTASDLNAYFFTCSSRSPSAVRLSTLSSGVAAKPVKVLCCSCVVCTSTSAITACTLALALAMRAALAVDCWAPFSSARAPATPSMVSFSCFSSNTYKLLSLARRASAFVFWPSRSASWTARASICFVSTSSSSVLAAITSSSLSMSSFSLAMAPLRVFWEPVHQYSNFV